MISLKIKETIMLILTKLIKSLDSKQNTQLKKELENFTKKLKKNVLKT